MYLFLCQYSVLFLLHSSVIQFEISDYHTSSSSLLFQIILSQADVAHAFNPSTLMAEAICSRRIILSDVFCIQLASVLLGFLHVCFVEPKEC